MLRRKGRKRKGKKKGKMRKEKAREREKKKTPLPHLSPLIASPLPEKKERRFA